MNKSKISAKQLFEIHCILTSTENNKNNFKNFMINLSDEQISLCLELDKYLRRLKNAR